MSRLPGRPTVFPRLAKDDSGQTLIEFALTLPLLLMLLIGIFWGARAFNIYQTITRAAREGARAAVAPSCASCTPSNSYYAGSYIRTNVIEPALQASSMDPTQIQNYSFQSGVVLNPSPTNPSEPLVTGVVVSFSYPFTFSIPFTSINSVNIPTTVQMRTE